MELVSGRAGPWQRYQTCKAEPLPGGPRGAPVGKATALPLPPIPLAPCLTAFTSIIEEKEGVCSEWLICLPCIRAASLQGPGLSPTPPSSPGLFPRVYYICLRWLMYFDVQ